MWTEGNWVPGFYIGLSGNCVNNTLYRFLIVTRCLENLSSGEKRAVQSTKKNLSLVLSGVVKDSYTPGWADLVIFWESVNFYMK